jgi:hypothetical protein
MKTASVYQTAKNMVRYIKSGDLNETTLRNLIIHSDLEINEAFYSGLKWLINQNKIVFLITPVETYVLPLE